MNKKILGELIENRVIIWNLNDSKNLFGSGYYGKPLGIAKPKGINFESPLILDLVESYYLIKRGKLIVMSRIN
jgi:tRNA-intron endonuclease